MVYGVGKRQSEVIRIAKKGGLYKHDHGKSHGVGLADAILAATAEAENADLKREIH